MHGTLGPRSRSPVTWRSYAERFVFSQSLSLSLQSWRLGVSGESQRGETETEHLVLAKLLECGVKHRFGLDGRMALLPPKAVSALRFGTAVQDLAEFRR